MEPERMFGTAEGRALVGERGEVLDSVASTMDAARERLIAGAPDGYVVVAEHQAAGRGRAGLWRCPPGLGLLLSVVLRISLPAGEQKLIVLLGAVAAAEALGRLGVPARIKWPNDIVVADPEPEGLTIRKLGGVLVEQVRVGDAAGPFVLGIGLNVNQTRNDLPPDAVPAPTSMRIEKGQKFDRAAVCRSLLRELSAWYRRLRMGESDRILARWRRLNCLLHKRVTARVEGRLVRGTVAGLRRSGELILDAETGGRLFLSDQKAKLLP